MSKLKSQIESLLFISNQPFSVRQIINLTKAGKEEVETAFGELMTEYNTGNKGVNIQKVDDKFQMVTAADNTKIVKDFVKQETTGELTRAALETLTIIAYRGPVARAELEQIRGVNCAVILRNLLIRGLVETIEDKKKMQTSYNISLDFLKHLGLNQQSELPDYEKLSSHESVEKILSPLISEEKEQ